MACWMPVPWYWKFAAMLTGDHIMAVYLFVSLARGSLSVVSISSLATLHYAVTLLSRAILALKDGNASYLDVLKRIDDYLKLRKTESPQLTCVSKPTKSTLPAGPCEIEFKNVFTRSQQALACSTQRTSFTVPRGKLTIIVGDPGSGKSTIIKLMTGLVQLIEGCVSVNGQQLTGLNRRDLLTRTVYMSHEDQVLPLSLEENLSFGLSNSEKTRSKVKQILDLPLFRSLQEKFKPGVPLVMCSLVKFSVFGCGSGDIGTAALDELKKHDVQQDIAEPSGEESQKILAARGILRLQNRPDLVIMDDAASKMGSEDESRLHDLLLEQSKGATVIVASARPQRLLGLADHILFVDSGAVVQQGTHQELADKCGPYRDWYSSQNQFASDKLKGGDERTDFSLVSIS